MKRHRTRVVLWMTVPEIPDNESATENAISYTVMRLKTKPICFSGKSCKKGKNHFHFLVNLILIIISACTPNSHPPNKPNLIFVFADQWRAEATGFAGNKQVLTPAIDKFASENVVFTNAISTFPVCTPYRGMLMTGQYPLTNRAIINDSPLHSDATCIADVFRDAGYHTAYIGKWHLNGGDREAFIPLDRRQGFDYWKVHECTHNYNNSLYWDNDDEKKKWEGYDAIAQTNEAINYLENRDKNNPFIVFLSWGPPHDPYQTAPEEYRNSYADPGKIELLPNVPTEFADTARKTIAGYYAHIAALDVCFDKLLKAVESNGLGKNTIIVFTSDHGDMLFSHGLQKKQKPWDESLKVPFIIKCPQSMTEGGRIVEMPIGTPDIMPTLLSLCGIRVPESAEGDDYAGIILGNEQPSDKGKLFMCPVPHGQGRYSNGGREYRGLRTIRYTYAEDLNGPWLLYDNLEDPFQLKNLINNENYADLKKQMAGNLRTELEKRNDRFLGAQEYMDEFKLRWNGNDSLKTAIIN